MSILMDEIREHSTESEFKRIRELHKAEEIDLTDQVLSLVDARGSKGWRAVCDLLRREGMHVGRLNDPTTGNMTPPAIADLFGFDPHSLKLIYLTSNNVLEIPTSIAVRLLVGVLWKPSADELILIEPKLKTAVYITEDGDALRYDLPTK